MSEHGHAGGGHGPSAGTILFGAGFVIIALAVLASTVQGRGPFNESTAVYARSTPQYATAPPPYVALTPTYEAPPRYVRVASPNLPPPVTPGERRMLEAAYGE